MQLMLIFLLAAALSAAAFASASCLAFKSAAALSALERQAEKL